MDEAFGLANFRNAIIVKRRITKNLQEQFESVQALPQANDEILWYSKSPDRRFSAPRMNIETKPEGYWHHFWSNADRPTMRYELLGVTPASGQWKWEQNRAMKAVQNYQEYLKKNPDMPLAVYWEKTGRSLEFIRLSKKGKVENWFPPSESRICDTLWLDVHAYENVKEYPTEKHEELLARIIEASSEQGDLVLDCFVGSGTTAVVAEKLNRRWIACDLSRFGPEAKGPGNASQAHRLCYSAGIDVPEEVRKAVKHWSQMIDYWAVDWDYKGDTFHNQWQSYRTRKEPNRLDLETAHTYSEAGIYIVVVKVIDLLGNDTTKTLEVAVS